MSQPRFVSLSVALADAQHTYDDVINQYPV